MSGGVGVEVGIVFGDEVGIVFGDEGWKWVDVGVGVVCIVV